MGYHSTRCALHAGQNNRKTGSERSSVKWKDSAEPNVIIPMFWNRFPEGSNIIDTGTVCFQPIHMGT